MATEIQIREAIAGAIETAAPLAIVLPRDILNIAEDEVLTMLQSSSDENRVRGWVITLAAMTVSERFQNGAEYRLRYDVWQFYEYRTGDNTENSEDVFSAEREAVVAALSDASLDPIIVPASAIEFSAIRIQSVGTNRTLVHMARGVFEVLWRTVGCA